MFGFFKKLFQRAAVDHNEFPHDELTTITMFAAGHTELRDEAIEAHHRLLHDRPDLRYHAAQAFMAEVDSSCPDLNLRRQYRDRLAA